MLWQRLTEPALKRLYKFVLKRVLGSFLLHELDVNQLQVHLGQGSLHLVELELNAQVLNAQLAGLPFQVKRGFLGSVRVQVSYANLANEGCVVEIEDIDLVLEPAKPSTPMPAAPAAEESPNASPKNEYDVDEVSQEGLDFVATWIERVTSKIKITLANVCISVEDPEHCSCALMLRIQWLEISDETPMDNGSIAASTAAVFGVLHKNIRIKGWQLELVHLHRDSMENEWSDNETNEAKQYTVVPIIVSPPDHPSFIQFKQAQYPAMGFPDLDLDIFIHSMQMVIQPSQLLQLQQLIQTFTQEKMTPNPMPPQASMYHSICDQAPTWLQDTSDEVGADGGAFTLSLTEFKRIEKLLHQYQVAHQELRQSALIARDRQSTSLPTPTKLRPMRHISSAESVDSVGLSDLDEDDFQDCTTGSSLMASSMYMSAMPPPTASLPTAPAIEPPATATNNKVLTKCKVHIAHVELALVYEDIIDDELPSANGNHQLPNVAPYERLVLAMQDIVVQVAVMTHWTSCSLAIPSFTLDELICPRLSLDAMDNGQLLSSRIVQFHGNEKDIVVYLKLEENATSITVHGQPLQFEYDMYMLQRLQTFFSVLDALSQSSSPAKVESAPVPMTVEVNFPSINVHVRFPLIPSDPIRFGPSSNRGNCEDILILELEKVKITMSGLVCDHVAIHLEYPPGGDQRSLHRTTETICNSSTMAQGVSIQFSLQNPTQEQLQTAYDCKANLRDTFTSDASLEKGHVGSQDGSEPGLQAQALQSAAIAASQYHVIVTVPSAVINLKKAAYDRLMILTEALLSINPVDITGLARLTTLRPCFMSMDIFLQEGELLLNSNNDQEEPYRLTFDHAHVFQVTQWLGSLTSRMHLSVHNLSLFHGNVPILYKTCWGVPKPSPILLCLMETTEIAEDMRDISLQLHFSHITWRYDMSSNWLSDVLAILLTEYPQAIVPLDTPMMETSAIDRDQAPVPLAVPVKTVFTKLMLQCYQGVIDYAPPNIEARALLILGTTSLSSNLVTNAQVQGYKVSVSELSLFCHPQRASEDEGGVYYLEDQWLRNQLARTDGSMQETVEHLGFLQVATLDMVDLFVRVSDAVGETQLQLELCLGVIQLKVCFDSFETLLLVTSTWWEEFASQATPEIEEKAAPPPLVPVPLSPTGERAPLNIMEQIDLNMFNKPTNASDTEARLLHHQVKEAKKPAPPNFVKPLIIDDFFTADKKHESNDNPWFTSQSPRASLHASAAMASSPVLQEASARWIPKEESVEIKHPSSPTVASSFEAVEDSSEEDDRTVYDANTTLNDLVTMNLSINETEEVELELNLDGDMRQELDRLLQADAQEADAMTEDEEMSPKSSNLDEGKSPLASPTYNENTARWYTEESNAPPAIYTHHIEIPISGTAAALSFGEKELSWAHQTMAKESTKTIPTPILIKSILLRDFNVQMRLFGGFDWASSSTPPKPVMDPPVPKETQPAKNTIRLLDALLDNYVDDAQTTKKKKLRGARPSTNRKTEEMLELSLSNIKLRLDLYEENMEQPLASNTVLHVGDIEVLDYISTSQIRKLLCYWKSDTLHPRETGTPVFHLHLMTLRPDALHDHIASSSTEEHRVKIKLLPLRINLDQDVLDFLKHFAPKSSTPVPPPAPVEAPTALQPPTLVLNEQNTTPSSSDWFFQSVDIRAFKIKIDYRPQRVDYEALRAGDYIEVINLFVLEGMELTLRHIKLSGVNGWDALLQQTMVRWVEDISRHQIHKCLASVVPMRSITNIGAGAADLILLPMAQYGKDRRVVRGLRKGAKSFLKSVTIETLNTASRVARGTKALLEHADEVIHESQKRKKHSFNNRKGNTHARYLMSQPATASEGLSQAYASMSRELHVVAKTIVAVPLLEYQRTGSHGYVKSVIRAVPVAVLRPMIGATEAMSRALIGVRNAVDPEIKEDMENKFKDMGN